MRYWAWGTTFLCMLLGGLLAWREGSWQAAATSWGASEAALEHRVGALESSLKEASRKVDQRAETLQVMETETQNLRDRLTNLEAQRDHLRSEVDQKMEELASMRTTIENLEEALSEARTSLLEATEAPARLTTSLNLARQRIETLEATLDEEAGSNASVPSPLIFEGLSSDRRAFALSGPGAPIDSLPQRVYLCQRDEVVLEGYIHKIEEGFLHGHVKAWHQSASALVKGEKVFIFRLHETQSD